MKTLRRILALAVLAALLSGISACGGAPGVPTQQTPGPGVSETSVQFSGRQSGAFPDPGDPSEPSPSLPQSDSFRGESGRLDCPIENGGTAAVWWWDQNRAFSAPFCRKALPFLAENRINRIYLCLTTFRDEKLIAFVRAAGEYGIDVCFLCGDASFIDEGAPGGYAAVDRYLSYQQTAPEDARLAALHFDVEPHQKTDFFDRRSEYLQDFADFAGNVSALLHEKGEKVEWDLPFWFDSDTVKEETGEETTFLDFMAKRSDVLCLMSYRNTASAVLEISRQEIAACQKASCAVVCGVDCASQEGPDVSFAQKGKATMYAELEIVFASLRAQMHDQGSGVAIHYLDTWMDLPD